MKRNSKRIILMVGIVLFFIPFFKWCIRSRTSGKGLARQKAFHRMLSTELDNSLDQVSAFKNNSIDLKANGVFLALSRNNELEGMSHTIDQLERSFNSKYQYPYLFLNDEPFTQEFMDAILSRTSAQVEFGVIPKEHWSVPEWIDKKKLKWRLNYFHLKSIPYGGLESYRHMCRYYSGFFYKHPLILKYDYYWRIEPDVDYPCKLDYDPFAFMKFSNKKYGFNIVAKEFMETVRHLWDRTKSFSGYNGFLDVFGTINYNGIHYWSNFEIGDLNWFRSKEYNDYFNHLDISGGRWGDAPVHSLAAGLLLKLSQVHFFQDIGYRHMDRLTCPIGEEIESKKYKLDCSCDLRNYKDSSRWVYRDDWKEWIIKYLLRSQKIRQGVL